MKQNIYQLWYGINYKIFMIGQLIIRAIEFNRYQ